ncbi:hypothetical protein JTB14_030418 [Gonioctena quinquepunctata]|nr:hypothetical protein JTB14_030418 [Gonioctena quinquepunctata]
MSLKLFRQTTNHKMMTTTKQFSLHLPPKVNNQQVSLVFPPKVNNQQLSLVLPPKVNNQQLSLVLLPKFNNQQIRLVFPSEISNQQYQDAVYKEKKTYEESLLAILKEKKAEPIDEDQSFLLSSVPSFKVLNDTQKLDAKMEFLSTLKRLTQSNQHSFYQTSQGYGAHQSYGYPGNEGNFVSPPNTFRTYNIETYQ